MQSIELSNKSNNNTWSVYICGGNESVTPKEGLQISRFTMTKAKNTISNCRRVIVDPQASTGKSLSGNREIEGSHINGAYLEFLITRVPNPKNPQYIYRIKKSKLSDESAKVK